MEMSATLFLIEKLYQLKVYQFARGGSIIIDG